MVRVVLVGAILGAAIAAGAPRLKDRPGPEFPEGRWTVESYELNGQSRDAAAMAAYVLVHTRTTAALEMRGREVMAEQVTWTTAGGVQHADFTSERWVGVKRAIWKLDGDTLMLCESAADGDRPTEFIAPMGSGRTLWVLKRVKE